MVLAFSGWMDGGDVSTGSVDWLTATLDTRPAASIDPEGCYIYNFPGSMEISALFRPYAEIEEGMVTTFELVTNTFYWDEANQLILFRGKEPNLNWSSFADCIFDFASRSGVTSLYFVGSYGGLVPHTREPRLVSTVSDETMKPMVQQYGMSLANYEGPGSFATYLMTQAPRRGVRMMSVVAEIPSYVEGTNPKSIETVLRKLAALLDLQVDLDELRSSTDSWERRLNKAIEEKPELDKHIRKLEEDYDNEVFDTQMGDLKAWLEGQGIRVD